MNINSKSTKAEILQAYTELRARPTTAEDVWLWVSETATIAARETVELVKDCYRLGQATRRWYDHIVAELSRPIIKA